MRRAAFLLGTVSFYALFAQVGRTMERNKSAERFNPKKGFSVVQPSELKKAQKVAIAKLALHFKVVSSGKARIGHGAMREQAESWAVLDGVSESTLQAIADEFYAYLAQRLAQTAGWQVLPYSEVAGAKAFSRLQEKQIPKTMEVKNEGAVLIKTAFDGPHTRAIMGTPGTWNAYQKVAEELKAHVISIDIVVDFAKFDIELERFYGYSYVYKSVEAGIVPEISIESMLGEESFKGTFSALTLVSPRAGMAGEIRLMQNVTFPGNYADGIDWYSSPPPLLKNFSYFRAMPKETFVVKANEQRFKEMALQALKQYADFLVQRIVEVRQ